MNPPDDHLGQQAQLACLWEVTARKPGNVHRFRDFTDTTYLDFAVSAAAIAPVLALAPQQSVGWLVLEGLRRTRTVTRRNTNLGILLLLAPLARGATHLGFHAGVEEVLAGLTLADAGQVYEAIRSAAPGGLGDAPEQDVRQAPTLGLREAMALAADRDLVARQYVNGFREVLDDGAPALLAGIDRTGCLEGGIVHAHLHLMSCYPDSLIARKCGPAAAYESADRARGVLELDWPHTTASRAAIRELDVWLRAVGNTRNPGTTADLIAACLFVLLRQDRLPQPGEIPWALPEEAL